MGHIELKNICKDYDGHPVLKGIDLEVHSGEFLVILGASGGGKTTLLNLLAGLIPPSSGSIHFDGNDVTAQDAGARNIAFVFQDYALYPHMSVEKNILFPLANMNMPEADASRKVEEALDLLKLGEVRNKLPGQLSGGQKQRVAIGRALVRDPFVFLFDEPLSSLDQQLRDHLRVELKQLHRELGKTFVYVTHDQLSAMVLGDRIAFIADGRIHQIAPPQELYDRPVNLEVAGFLGFPPINLLTPENYKLLNKASVPASTARVGLRPEHLQGLPDAKGPFEVQWIQKAGYANYACFNVGTESVSALCPEHVPSPGGKISCRVQKDRVLFFDEKDQTIL